MVLFRELKGLQKAARSEGFGEENIVDLMYGREMGVIYVETKGNLNLVGWEKTAAVSGD